jgi:hypothetical protein
MDLSNSFVLFTILVVVLMHPGVNLTTQRDVWPRDLASIVIRVNDLLLRSTNNNEDAKSSVYIYDSSDSSGSPLFLGGVEVERGEEDGKPERNFIPQIEIEELRGADYHFYMEDNVQAANRIWTVVVVPLEGTYTPDITFIILGGSIIFFSTLLLALWVYSNSRRIAEANQRAERLLLNVLPEEMASRLKSDPHHVADYYENATILFADIVGFTKLCSKVSPTEVVRLLNDLFSRFDTILDKYGLNKVSDTKKNTKETTWLNF